MKNFYALVLVMIAAGALAFALAFTAFRRGGPASAPGAIQTLTAAIATAAGPTAGEANRPASEANVTPPAPPPPSPQGVGSSGPAEPASAERAKAPASASRAGAPGEGGMIVVLDPETGTYGAPTPQQARTLTGASTDAVSRSDAGLVERVGPGGAIGVDLHGRFQDYATITIGPDGRKRFGCVHGASHAGACRDSVPAPAPLEVQ